MPKVNMLEAKTNLSKLVEQVETGKEPEIILARNGKPVARIVPLNLEPRQLGLGEGLMGEMDEGWFKEWQALDKVIWAGWDARWERFAKDTRELERKAEKKKRKKSA